MADAKIRDLFNRWFWSWLGITLVFLIIMSIAPASKEWLSATILGLFMVMPLRSSFYRFVVWLIDYMTSNNTSLKDKINPHATMNTMSNPTTRTLNVGTYRILWAVIATGSLVLALFWFVFNNTAFNVVYMWIHSIELLVTFKLSPIQVLLFVITKIVYYGLIIWSWNVILNSKMFEFYDVVDEQGRTVKKSRFSMTHGLWRIAVMLINYYANIFLTGLCLEFTASMVSAYFVYKTVLAIFGLPALYFIMRLILRKLFSQEKDSSDDPVTVEYAPDLVDGNANNDNDDDVTVE